MPVGWDYHRDLLLIDRENVNHLFPSSTFISFLNVVLMAIKKLQQTNNRLYNHLKRLLLIISGWNTGFADGETQSSAMLLEGLILGMLKRAV